MGKTAAVSIENKELLGRISALYQYIINHDDVEVAMKLKQLARKVYDHEYTIAFCGHFSAGKSSIINYLLGDSILPTSPIPTSANLVKLSGGGDYAKVHLHNNESVMYEAPYDYDEIKAFCKNGEQISLVEIRNSATRLPSGVAVLDTPGIDSTDEAHRLATESALHLSDMIFYCMDYNHVQSEVNLLFTKELVDAGKDVYFIINQIDKHRDEELSFTDFKDSVQRSFASWGVHPKQVFYTSLKDLDQKQNQLDQLQIFIWQTLRAKEQLLPTSVLNALNMLVANHIQNMHNQNKSKIESLKEYLAAFRTEEVEHVSDYIEELKQELSILSTFPTRKLDDLKRDIETILENAYLMPFQTREKAKEFLESTQKEFKIGFLFSKQKTEQERDKRQHLFLQELQERVQSQIEWHVKECLLQTIRRLDLVTGELEGSIQSFNITVTLELLLKAVKKDASLSGEYVLHYTNELVEFIKKEARNQLYSVFNAIDTLLSEKNRKVEGEKQQSLMKWMELKETKEQYAYFAQSEQLVKEEMERILLQPVAYDKLQPVMDQLVAMDEVRQIVHTSADKHSFLRQEEPVVQPLIKEMKPNQSVLLTPSIEETVQQLQTAARRLQRIRGFQSVASDLLTKATNLAQKGFTIALFGAFSAGKSTLANALIGESLLPVSPNPTTAAINKIMPVDEAHPHGLVLVKIKEAEQLLEEVNRSLQRFQLYAHNLDEAVVLIAQMKPNLSLIDYQEQVHYGFMTSFSKGFENVRAHLGQIIHENLEAFPDYVAKEERSCFVETIEVYYDCQLTRQGITLVDTPGADSIHARHTGVAFEYIKNSDAVLFVTYYNHAFSKADREFLIQLGRVKDSFALDKMFFLVNAVDLANNDEELQAVLSYVSDQLVGYGIRFPTIYPVSSMLALRAKKDQTAAEEYMERFEQKFYSFIQTELTQLAISGAVAELDRARELIEAYMDSSSKDEQDKKQQLEKLYKERDGVLTHLKQWNQTSSSRRLKQEVDELAFYIKQRVFYRLPDFFKEAFHPGLLKDDGRDLKAALKLALADFLESIGYDLTQEIRATSLRVERFAKELLKENEEKWVKQITSYAAKISFAPFEPAQATTIDFSLALTDFTPNDLKKAFSHFKNPKSFFEKNDKKRMMDELEQLLQKPAERYISDQITKLNAHYEDYLFHEQTALLAHIQKELGEYYEVREAALGTGYDKQELIEVRELFNSFGNR